MVSKVLYKGALRNSCLHLKSGQVILTDAPVDNNGKGEAFSPTDLVATALASCMLTIMGIRAPELNVDLEDTQAEVTKIMESDPRRIAAIEIRIILPEGEYSKKIRKILESAALNCPVAKSISEHISQSIQFEYPDQTKVSYNFKTSLTRIGPEL